MANRLINEQSPYLLQHAHNPVDWYPWGEEAFTLAREQHKPVIVSIGYAACHWCHVMERESFESAEVAAFMNEHFVCIKVDREEHPDVDHFYMDAIQAISGSGGWPLNAFVTPDKVPFYGGTYYPPRPGFNRPSWMQLLHRIVELWHGHQDEVMQQAGQMTEHLQQASQRMVRQVTAAATMETCDAIAASLLQQADKEKGGFGNAPKFPGTMAITYLLEHYHYSGSKPALEHALRSLDAMIEGGIYDQLGGGFARYATDRDWLIPHFEKMLYDNALLILALCDAYSITGNENYRRVVAETIAFADRELRDASGGYYCALDADSEGVEGKFYTWTWDEWCTTLGTPHEAVAAHLGVSMHGNWEETNILNIAMPLAEAAAAYGLAPDELDTQVAAVKEKLLQVRNGRIRPLTDNKCLLGWNALMNKALSRAAIVFANDAWLQQANAHMDWMLNTYSTHGGYMHTWKQGRARIPAKLDDLAYLADALLALGEASGDVKRILAAGSLAEQVIASFSREDGFFYFTSATQTDIPVRKVDLYDGAQPSANAVMAHVLQVAGMCLERTDWLERSAMMLRQMSETAQRYAYSFSHWATLLQRKVKGPVTAVCGGPSAGMAAAQLRAAFTPHAYVVLQPETEGLLPVAENKFFEGELYIFVCSEHACMPPVSTAEEASRLVNQ